MSEQWRAVPGFGDRYEVSDQGRIRSWARSGASGQPRLMRPHLNEAGYFRVGLHDLDGMRVTRSVHQFVALAFHGPRPWGMEIRHLDGDSQNNRADNLAYGTVSENKLDTIRHGTHNHAKKIRCPQGHVYDMLRVRNGAFRQRMCRECDRARKRHYRLRQKLAATSEVGQQAC